MTSEPPPVRRTAARGRRALQDGILYVLHRVDFMAMCESFPGTYERMYIKAKEQIVRLTTLNEESGMALNSEGGYASVLPDSKMMAEAGEPHSSSTAHAWHSDHPRKWHGATKVGLAARSQHTSSERRGRARRAAHTKADARAQGAAGLRVPCAESRQKLNGVATIRNALTPD